ncbi:virulence-associated E family protein [Phocaeicola sartorii]|uniref:virulence-associated E family protein n=1 Tax=Phocaeicola sartorii TaxID=671267 RepID=UPI00272CDDFC|nr:virulence-associated E family protein [Phocaeicola sartorii]
MKPLNELNKEEILSGEIFEEVLNEEDETKRADLISDLKLKAKDLGVKGIFEEKLNTYKKIDRETKRKYKSGVSSNSAPPDSNIADVMQLLDYKIEYDNDGNEKSRKLQQTVRNFEIIMDNDSRFARKIKFDEFSRQEYLMGEIPWESENCDRAWGSHDDAALYSIIQTDYGMKNRNDYFDAIKNVSMRNKFHPVRDILDGLEFDGKEHIRSLLPDYLGVEDTEYSYQVMRLWMLGAVARVYEPGCKFDYTMIFTGPQGLGKSTFLKMMSLNDSWFNDSLDSLDSDKAAQSLMGSWIVELAELKSLARTAGGVESVKRFLTAVHDKYRVPYERRADIFFRQCVFAGTTNKSDFLQDETGNRRFLIIQTGVNKPTKSLFVPEAIEDMKAAWAQAVHVWKEERPELLLPDSCRDEARRLQDESMADDGKVGIITQFLENKQRTCVLEIWKAALERPDIPKKWESSEIMDIVLSIPGWQKMKNSTTFGEYGKQKGLQKVNQVSTKCQPSATNSLKNGENLEDSCQNSSDGFISIEDFEQEELPFQ